MAGPLSLARSTGSEFSRAGRMPDAEDVLGEVFLEVARRIGDFRGDSRGFRAWVFTIARSRRVDEIRRRARRQEDPIDARAHDIVPAGVDVEAEAIAMIGLDDLIGLLDQLTSSRPPRPRVQRRRPPPRSPPRR